MEVSSADLVATAGYSKRMGQLMPDNVVKVCTQKQHVKVPEGGEGAKEGGGFGYRQRMGQPMHDNLVW
jgi:hypothetical protein